MKSIRGIYHDLTESEYQLKYKEFNFVFSSLFYLNKFNKLKDIYVKNEYDKIKSKYVKIENFEKVILIQLYKKIEKRGFLVYYDNNKLEDFKFSIELESR